MNAEMGCDQVRDLAADLAIGIADGQERDAALRHAATCPSCRRLVAELSSVVDALLLLAPSHDPPPGFAAATLARISPPASRRRRATRPGGDRKSTRLNSSHVKISYAVFCLKKKKKKNHKKQKKKKQHKTQTKNQKKTHK